MFREDTMKWLTIAAGGMFFLSGLVSCLSYLYEKRQIEKAEAADAANDYRTEGIEIYDADGNLVKRRKPFFPILGIGCMILGAILALMPTNFILGVTYILAAILILGSINQMVTLVLARRYSTIPLLYWLFPLILLVIGIIVVAKPMEAATLPLKIIGWGLIVYGVVECINAVKIHSVRKQYEKMQEQKIASAETTETIEEAEVVEDDKEDDSLASGDLIP